MSHGIRPRLCVLTLVLAIFSTWPGAHAACYYPNGQVAPNDIPCRDDTPHAACCAPGYACLSNGICQATGQEQGGPDPSEFVRGACTDESWRNSNCPFFCIEEGVDFLGGGNGIAKCDNTSDDSYYCINIRSSGQATCKDRVKVLFFPGTPSAITTIGVVPPTTSSSSSTSTNVSSSSPADEPASATTSPPPGSAQNEDASDSLVPVPSDDARDEPRISSSDNQATIIGAAVGGTAAVILAGLGGWLLARRRGRNGSGKGEFGEGSGPKPMSVSGSVPSNHRAQEGPKSQFGAQTYATEVHEVPGTEQDPYYGLPHARTQYELPTTRRAELPGGCL